MFEFTQIVDDSLTFKPETIRALKSFKPAFKNAETPMEKLAACQVLLNQLAEVYGLPHILIGTDSVDAAAADVIVLSPDAKPSILSLLSRFAEIRKASNPEDEEFTNPLYVKRWAVNLYRKVYARTFATLEFNPLFGSFTKPRPVYAPAVEQFSFDVPEEPADGNTIVESVPMATPVDDENYTEIDETENTSEL